MFGDMSSSLIVVLAFALIMLIYSQQKFKNKVHIIMHTQAGIRLELWAPLQARHIRYGNKRRGDAGIYYLIPKYSSNTWWNKGVNMFFPVMVKTWEFWWFCPYPQDPMAIQRYDTEKKMILPAISWHTPEVRNAAWQEHQFRAFALASQQQSGKKPSSIERYLPLAAFGLALFALLLVWRAGIV